MFGFDEKKYEQEQLKFQKEEEYRQKRLQQEEFQADILHKVEEFLDNEKIKDTEQEQETDIITLNTGKYPVETKGFPHLALYVDATDEGQVIHVNYLTRRFDIVLKAGLNVLNLLDEMELSVDNVLSVGLVRSKKEFPVSETLKGSIVNSVQGTGNTTFTFATPCTGFSIVNDGATDLTFQIHSIQVLVKSGESFDGQFFIFNTVNITTTSDYRFTGRV